MKNNNKELDTLQPNLNAPIEFNEEVLTEVLTEQEEALIQGGNDYNKVTVPLLFFKLNPDFFEP